MTQRTAYHPKLCEECSSQKVNDALKFLENNLDEIKFNEFKKLLNVS